MPFAGGEVPNIEEEMYEKMYEELRKRRRKYFSPKQ